jgi:hypothetical protein
MISIEKLPEESLQLTSQFLPAQDVLSFLSTCKGVERIGLTPTFWKNLLESQFHCNVLGKAAGFGYWKEAKNAYLLQAHCHYLDRGVRWLPVLTNGPSAREGHLCCRLGQYIVLTGGFSDDDSIYVKDLCTGDTWQRIVPIGDSPDWVYGASLTAIDEHRAVRFGGFQAGGYSSETSQVAVLHLNLMNGNLQARWEIPLCHLHGGKSVDSRINTWNSYIARAYHSATLLWQRYVVVLGGMRSSSSCMFPLVLDTTSWTWFYENLTTMDMPSPRHGHSVVLDSTRGRLVLFGGGSGSDLLRSGRDNTEVWQLLLNSFGKKGDNMLASLPWVWNQLHEDQPNASLDDDDDDDDSGTLQEAGTFDPNQLSPAEKLCFGRCHASFLVSSDTVLFAFGSGRPTANAVMGFNLAQDLFFRPTVHGPLPKARFTFASLHLDGIGYIFFHGGYSTQARTSLSDSWDLDVAPGRKRNLRLWPINQQVDTARRITDTDALSIFARRFRPNQLLVRLIGQGDAFIRMRWGTESDEE